MSPCPGTRQPVTGRSKLVVCHKDGSAVYHKRAQAPTVARCQRCGSSDVPSYRPSLCGCCYVNGL